MDDILRAITIDWRWVEIHTLAREKIEKIGEGSTREAVFGQLKEALEIAKTKVVPKTSLAEIKILNFKPDSLELDGGIVFSTRDLPSHVKGSTRICAFLVTIGKGIEDAASSHMISDNHLLGYLLDRIGSFAVEYLAENIESRLRCSLASNNLSVSSRFSPGYRDWPIEEQFKLAKIVDFTKAGVILTENCMMIPRKSISAVVGIGSKELLSNRLSTNF